MNFDVIVFIGFLAINLILGVTSSKGANTIKEYAIGDRNFRTGTIVATIVATWISGEFFYSSLSEAYANGLHSIWIAVGDPICLLLIGVFFAPRMGEFLGKLSIAEAMGDLFGNKVRIVTAVSGFIGVAGIVAAQLKMAGFIFEYAIGIDSLYGIIISAIIVTLYSALGGIRAVTFTDIIQFFTFGTIIPLITYAIFTSIDNPDVISYNLRHSKLYDLKEVFDFSKSLPLKQLFLFLVFLVAGFNPAIFQRISMSRDTKQVSMSFIIAAMVCLMFAVVINWSAVLMFSVNPSLEASEIIKYAISYFSNYTGLKGAVFAGIMAMIMSTVDSFINSTAILVVHDFCQPLKMKFIKDELFSTKIASAFLGIAALALSLYQGSLLELLIIGYTLYMPIVVVPFIMAIFGFRSTEKSVLSGMVSGLVTVVIWDYVLKIQVVNSIPAAMVANLVVLMAVHYLFKQEGGWVGIKDNISLIAMRDERKLKADMIIRSIRSFDIFKTCMKHYPKKEGVISVLGVYIMIAAFAGTHTLAIDYQMQYKNLVDVIYPIILCISTIFITYPLWLPSWKRNSVIPVIWNLSIFSILICYNFFVVLISECSLIQLCVFVANVVVMSLLMTWGWLLFTTIFGMIITSMFHYQYIPEIMETSLTSIQFKIIYVLLFIISIVVVYVRPKRKNNASTDENTVLHADDNSELNKLLLVKNELLSNLNHELHGPITNLTNLGQVLDAKYDDYSEKKRRQVIKEIANSSIKLEKLINNIFNLSKISDHSYKLTKSKVNLTKLVTNSVNTCKKVYGCTEDQEFVLNLKNDVIVMCDEYFIKQTIDNLIANTIKYCKKGKIVITLISDSEGAEFCITNDVIALSQDEVDMFGSVVESQDNTIPEDFGMEFDLCKKAIESHQGQIWVEFRQQPQGAIFKFVLPRGM